jgi:hypothetical protein
MRTSFSHKLANLALAALLVLATSCGYRGIRGNGIIKTESRSLPPFAIVDASGAFEIEWHTGTPAVAVTVDENLLQYIRTSVVERTLQIADTERIWTRHKIKVSVTSPTLTGVKLSGACQFAGAQLAGDKFYIESSGATRVNANGNVTELVASMTGASRLDAESLQTRVAELSLTGASRADIAVAEKLQVAITGAGKVTYSGNPTSIQKDITGAGKISRRD